MKGVKVSDQDRRFVIIGAGMAGVLSAIKLGERGISNWDIYEKADRLGGTWRENTYPGIACDVPSYLYSYSFAPNTEWSHYFSPGPEIQAYFEQVAKNYGVFQDNSEITKLEYKDKKWLISGSNGLKDEADVVIAATGVLHHPKYPDIEGLDSFKGIKFHSARWDHSVDLTDKNVGIIGTGSSAVQIISSIAPVVKKLSVFQRTAQWVLKVENPPIPEEDKERYRKDPSLMIKLHEDLSQWFSANFADAVVNANSPQLQMLEKLCQDNLNCVKDPDLRQKLTPNYKTACKRLVVSPNFYEQMQLPNVELVTEPILGCEEKGIRTKDSKLHELDVLVLATGFRVDRFLRPIEVIGEGGIELDSLWGGHPTAYLAISVPHFPNLFMLNGPNGPVGNFSLVEVAELQFDYIMAVIETILDSKSKAVCPSPEAAEKFESERIEAAKNTIWVTGCKSWYLDDRGIPAAWPWTFEKFREEMSRPRLEDYVTI
jgi:cation diffusion facilitator CzcD-associated flavoprotein CzcO